MRCQAVKPGSGSLWFRARTTVVVLAAVSLVQFGFDSGEERRFFFSDTLLYREISILIDEDEAKRVPKSGIIDLEVEATGKLFARNIWLKRLQ